MRIGVNGRFLGAPVGGVRRFAREIAAGVLAEVGGVLLVPADVEGVKRLLPGARADVGVRRTPPDPRGEHVVGSGTGGVREPGSSAAPPPPGSSLRRGSLRGHAWEQVELPGAARRAGCDVVLHLANTAPLRGGPHVAVVHDVTPLTDPGWFRPGYRAWHRWVVRPALRRAAALLTVSRWSAGEVARVLEVAPDRVHTVPQGAAPLDEPAPPGAVDETRRRLGLPEFYLLAVGGRDPRKNVAFLLEVTARMEREGSPVPLVLVGGRKAGRVWAEPPEPPSGAPVLRVGEVDDRTLRALYTGASALCHPARAEGFGRPPLEALACGAPVVVAPYGPAREVLGDAAEVVPLDPDAWAATLRQVMSESPSRRARRVLEVCRAVVEGGPVADPSPATGCRSGDVGP